MSNEWRGHLQLVGRFHPDDPDVLQVVVHDGGPRMTDKRPELVWVRVLAAHANTFDAEVLNEPRQLMTVKGRDRIQFVVPSSGEHPIMVRQKYLDERGKWIINPCSTCGLSELFDAPSDLIATTFPGLNPEEAPEAFTAFCGVCGGVQVIVSTSADDDVLPKTGTGRKWWQIWT